MKKRWLILLVLLAGCSLLSEKELVFTVSQSDDSIEGNVFQQGVFLGKTENGVLRLPQENITEGALVFVGSYEGKPFNITFSISTDVLSAHSLRFSVEQERLAGLNLAFRIIPDNEALDGEVSLNGKLIGTTAGGILFVPSNDLDSGRVDLKGTYRAEPFEYRFNLKEHDLALNQMNFEVSADEIHELLFDASSLNRFSIEKEVHRLINIERLNSNAPELKWNPKVAEVALAHSEDMVARKYFAHKNPDGLEVGDRLKSSGFFYSVAAEDLSLFENIASTTNLSKKAVDGWMKSPGHRAPIVDPDYLFSDGGTGVACEDKTCYFTYVFVGNERHSKTLLESNYLSFQYLYDPSFGFTNVVPVRIVIESDRGINLYIVESRNAYNNVLNSGSPKSIIKRENVLTYDAQLNAEPGYGIILENRGSKPANISILIDYYP